MYQATPRQAGRFLALTVSGALIASFALTSPVAQAQDATPSGAPLAAQVGFSDPVLDKLQAEGVNTLGESLEFKAYNHKYRLISLWELQGSVPFPIGGAVLLFQTDSAKPMLRWSQDYTKLSGQAPYLSNAKMDFAHFPPPGDWNKNGKTEFAVLGSFSGTSWASTVLYIYELKADGTVPSRLKGVIPAGFIVSAAEPDLDGTIVLTVNDIRGEMAMGLPNCCGPHAVRYYDWRNDKISDASAQHSDKYFGTLGDALYQLTTQKFDDAAQYSARLLELLMAYDAIGQRDAGWSLANSLANSALAARRVPANGYLEKVFLPTEKQLYDQHKPFEVPDLVTGPQPSQSDDLYAKSQVVE